MERKLSTNISKVGGLNPGTPERIVLYKTNCACLENRHSQLLELSYDAEDVKLTIYATCDIWEADDSFIDKIWQRLKVSWKILVTGVYQAEHSFLMVGEDQVDDYIIGLQEGLSKIKKYRLKQNRKRRAK